MVKKSPYVHSVEPIKDIDRFFLYDEKQHTMTFIGKTLELRIPKRFEVYGLLTVADTVQTLAVFDMIIDEQYQCSLNLLASIDITPSEISDMVYDDVPYLVLYLKHGDRLITHTQVVKDQSIISALYVEFITRGKPLYTFGYLDLALLFDRAKALTGSGIGVDRVLFEMIISHLARDPSDIFKQYRYTDMAEPAHLIRLRSVSYAPSSTSARLLGSYFDDGLAASLIHHNESNQPFEDMLRGLPTENESHTSE